MFVLALAVTTPLGTEEWFKKERNQAVHIMVGNKNNVPSPAAIASIWPAPWDKLLTAEAATTIATVTGFGMHANLIYKLHRGKVDEKPSQVEWNLWKGSPKSATLR
jgi:hypothetical protein